ncbi:hypothetical protein FS837_008127 [Tulasnella sp. UAMH 9824]|nr:hypothetical protein FS837_008127 [Tulasnella sp. UAMH 9824]
MQETLRSTPTSPILSLSDDLTYYIFLDCHHTDRLSFAAIASAVCSQWRRIALSTPALWSTIIFEESLKNNQVARKMETRLERAQTAPLEIHIYGSAIDKPEDQSMSRIAELIYPSAQTWRSLVVHPNVPHLALQVLFDRLTNASAPQLEKLSIQPGLLLWHSELGVKWNFKAFGNGTPRLQSLRLSRCRFDWSSSIFNDLIELEVQDPRLLKMDRAQLIAIVRDLIIRSPRLRRLVVTGDFSHDLAAASDRPPPAPLQEILLHSALEYLRIPLCRGEVLDALLHSVKMPSLETLTGERSYYVLPFMFSTLAYVNALPSLRFIQIHGQRYPSTVSPQESAALQFALRTMPRLEEIEFRDLDLSRSESWLPDLLVWLPRLRFLEFNYCRGLLDWAVKEMVQCCSNSKSLRLALFSKVEFPGKPIDLHDESMNELNMFLRSQLEMFSTWE